jgi:hypothetical protein
VGTASERFARWRTDGTWAGIVATLGTQADGAGGLGWDAQVDASVVRARRGARKGGLGRQAASKRWGGHGAG